MKADTTALDVIRDHLDRMMYSLVDHRITLEAPPNLTGFPKYEALRRIVRLLDPAHETLFRLFRLGETVADEDFLATFPDHVVAALRTTGLVTASDGGWCTPGLLLVPANGFLLITGVPAAYPTADDRPKAVFDLSTSFVAAALPGSLAGRRVLDVCSGTGIQALLCAARGAEDVLGVELRESAVEVATMNAVLNGYGDRVRFRCSDMLSALGPEEQFDFVVANLPYAPAIGPRPTSLADIGTSLVWPLLDALPAHLSDTARGVVATWRAAGVGGSTYQLQAIAERLAVHERAVRAYVDPVSITVDGVLELLETDVRSLFAESEVDGFYNQIVHFEPGVAEPVTFGLSASRAPVVSSAR